MPSLLLLVPPESLVPLLLPLPLLLVVSLPEALGGQAPLTRPGLPGSWAVPPQGEVGESQDPGCLCFIWGYWVTLLWAMGG